MQSKAKPQSQSEQSGFRTTIPTATYRIQFNKEFTFADAVEIVPYLAELGVSHIYSSPFFRARPGSMHGYDIIDHSAFNPEIGNADEFNELVAKLREHGMGLIVDFVPNHMGIGSDNPWWMDVLENGPASAYAHYFDIDWAPVKRELFGKVLLPVLGESYGNILASGQLKLSFDCETGKLRANYYDHWMPLDPVSYPIVLGHNLDALKEQLGADNLDVLEFQSILSALEMLPGHIEPIGFAQRIGEKNVQMRRLAKLCATSPAVSKFVQESVDWYNNDGEEDPTQRIQRLHNLLEMQPYRLAYWRVAADEINYRRFFDINDLAAIRTEDARVFNDIHSLIFDLAAEKLIDGIRIDHPDGLYDPETYFRRVQQVCGERLGVEFKPPQGHESPADVQSRLPIYMVAEKILAPFETLEENWLVHGTTGYEFLDTLNNLLVTEENEAEFNAAYEDFIGHKSNYEEMRHECKELILDSVLSSELNVLAHRLDRIAESSFYFRDFTLSNLRLAIRNIVVHFPVYRTYITATSSPESAHQYIDWAVKLAKRNTSVPWAVYDFVAGVLKGDLDPQKFGGSDIDEAFAVREKLAEFAMKFQQFTGPVTAKSIEDTLFYRYNRLICLNEVGAEPKRFGTSAAAFHRQNSLRQEKKPYSMLGTSTHDTKRSEDTRARIAALSGLPGMWRQRVNKWANFNEKFKTKVDDELWPDRNDEYLLYQNILGVFPSEDRSESNLAAFRERIKQYAMKAIKEAKVHTSWIVPNEAYEKAIQDFVEKILTPGEYNDFLKDVQDFVDYINPFGLSNALAQAVLKLTSPGVPDIYQGNELWDFSLVDPDNRRPVDFDLRADMLKGTKLRWNDGSIKFHATKTLLQYRKKHADVFTRGKYIPLEVTGERSAHALAFARVLDDDIAITVVPLKPAALFKGQFSPEMFGSSELWGDTAITLPEEINFTKMANLFTGTSVEQNKSSIEVSKLFADHPVAVLVKPGDR
jgi:(1->4)-alpha-D-glucan 1-alpha-D-glucosylmutase